MKYIKNIFFLLCLVIVVIAFFSPFFLRGKLPIPSDTIVGLYHPYRDFYFSQYPRGIPFKNFLITDPVRQLYVWKELSVSLLFKGEIPLWNPYEMTGKPLLANIQSGPFYPLNLIFIIKPFYVGWSLFIFSSMLLSGIFMYFYLMRNRLSHTSAFIGSIAFIFSGFIVSWLEWGNIVHTILWLPLILASIDALLDMQDRDKKINKKTIVWFLILTFSLIASFLSGHLQTFFYVAVFSILYFLFEKLNSGKKLVVPIILSFLAFVVITAVYSLKIFEFISLSARSIDQSEWTKVGWFIPWKHLAQFFSPDFFGNPTTLNYWGDWNYAEFAGFIGVIPIVFAFIGGLFIRERKNLFYLVSAVISLLFALPNTISYMPFLLKLPIISSSQPTRLLAITCFCLSVLASFGVEKMLKEKESIRKKTLGVISVLTLTYACLWLLALRVIGNITLENASVAKRNLIFPSAIFILCSVILFLYLYSKKALFTKIIISILVLIAVADGFRFASKFNPFTEKSYLFPSTQTIEFLKRDKDIYRIASADSRIFPPNFSTYYRIQTIEGYDPLYLRSYARLITLNESEGKNLGIQNFNRIITPRNLSSKIINLLNVKYVLSLSDIKNSGFKKVFQEGQTQLYKNDNASKRTFFVESVYSVGSEDDAVKKIIKIDLKKEAVVEGLEKNLKFSKGNALISYYSENRIAIKTNNENEGFLVLTDAYYPGWKARVDGKITEVHKTNVAFRGIIVPGGKHIVEFYLSIL